MRLITSFLQVSLFSLKKILIRLSLFSIDHKKPTIIAIGDSWINFTLYYLVNEPLTYIKSKFKKIDTADWLYTYKKEFNIIDCGFPGYVLADEIKNKFFSLPIKKLSNKDNCIYLLSFGGNDITLEFQKFVTKGGNLKKKLLRKVMRLNLEYLKSYMDSIRRNMLYRGIYRCPIFFIHGYDYFHPELDHNHSRFKFLFSLNLKKRQIKNLVKELLIVTNDELKKLSNKIDNLYYINLMGTVPSSKWFEPIHPNSDGFKIVANKLIKEIRKHIN